MSEVRWLKIRAWHVWSGMTKGWQKQTLCGRWLKADAVLDRPGNEATCETCLRIQVGR